MRTTFSSSSSRRARRWARPNAAKSCATPGFDLWCGDELCAWKLERGEVKRVATWHEADAGVELVGSDAAIEQLAPVNSGDGTCIRFDLVANVDRERRGRAQRRRLRRRHARDARAHPDVELEAAVVQLRDRRRRTTASASRSRRRAPARRCSRNIGAEHGARMQLRRSDADRSGPAPRRRACARRSADCASGMCGGSPTPFPAIRGSRSCCLGCDDDLVRRRRGRAASAMPLSPVFEVPVECVAHGARRARRAVHRQRRVRDPTSATTACARACTHAAAAAQRAAWDPNGPYVCSAGRASARGDAVRDRRDCASGTCNGSRAQANATTAGRATIASGMSVRNGRRRPAERRLHYSRHPRWTAASDPQAAYRAYGPALVRKAERMLRSREDAVDVVHALFVDLIPRWTPRRGPPLPLPSRHESLPQRRARSRRRARACSSASSRRPRRSDACASTIRWSGVGLIARARGSARRGSPRGPGRAVRRRHDAGRDRRAPRPVAQDDRQAARSHPRRGHRAAGGVA